MIVDWTDNIHSELPITHAKTLAILLVPPWYIICCPHESYRQFIEYSLHQLLQTKLIHLLHWKGPHVSWRRYYCWWLGRSFARNTPHVPKVIRPKFCSVFPAIVIWCLCTICINSSMSSCEFCNVLRLFVWILHMMSLYMYEFKSGRFFSRTLKFTCCIYLKYSLLLVFGLKYMTLG
jgi:hypothetical protein